MLPLFSLVIAKKACWLETMESLLMWTKTCWSIWTSTKSKKQVCCQAFLLWCLSRQVWYATGAVQGTATWPRTGNYLLAYATTEGYLSWATTSESYWMVPLVKKLRTERASVAEQLGVEYENVYVPGRKIWDAELPSSSDNSCLLHG